MIGYVGSAGLWDRLLHAEHEPGLHVASSIEIAESAQKMYGCKEWYIYTVELPDTEYLWTPDIYGFRQEDAEENDMAAKSLSERINHLFRLNMPCIETDDWDYESELYKLKDMFQHMPKYIKYNNSYEASGVCYIVPPEEVKIINVTQLKGGEKDGC